MKRRPRRDRPDPRRELRGHNPEGLAGDRGGGLRERHVGRRRRGPVSVDRDGRTGGNRRSTSGRRGGGGPTDVARGSMPRGTARRTSSIAEGVHRAKREMREGGGDRSADDARDPAGARGRRPGDPPAKNRRGPLFGRDPAIALAVLAMTVLIAILLPFRRGRLGWRAPERGRYVGAHASFRSLLAEASLEAPIRKSLSFDFGRRWRAPCSTRPP